MTCVWGGPKRAERCACVRIPTASDATKCDVKQRIFDRVTWYDLLSDVCIAAPKEAFSI